MPSLYDNAQNNIIASLEQQLAQEKSFARQLYLHNKIGAHKKVRGLAPNDTYPYSEAALQEAQETWECETYQAIVDAHLPREYQQKLLWIAAKNPNLVPGIIENIESHPSIALDADYREASDLANKKAEDYERRHDQYLRLQSVDVDEAEKLFEQHLDDAKSFGFNASSNMNQEGFYSRAKTSDFWLKLIQKMLDKLCLQAGRVLQMVGYGAGRTPHLPAYILNRKHQQIDLTEDWLTRTIVTNLETGEKIKLIDIIKDKPLHQFHELQVRVIAHHIMHIENGHQPWFLTITTPSRFHASKTIKNGKKKQSIANPNFDQSLHAIDAVRWLQRAWERFRALAQKITGGDWGHFGNVEPHADATPHKHLVLYCRPEHREAMHRAVFECFLYNDNPDEPGAAENRVKIEKPRSDGGVKKYIMKVLRYTLKTLKDKKKLSAEALFTRAISCRTFALTQDKVSLWRWLSKLQNPYPLPPELYEAWAASRGIDSSELSVILEEMHKAPWKRSKKRFRGGKRKPAHYVRFMQATKHQDFTPAWKQEDYYNIEEKTFEDFKIETADPQTGEIDEELAWEEMYTAWMMAWDGDDSAWVKSKTRKKNKYGEDKNPCGYEKAPYWVNKKTGAIASRKIEKYTKETKKPIRKDFFSFLKERELQLRIRSQGAETRASTGFEVSTDLESWENSAIEAANANFTSPAPPPH